jgi:glucosamine--fructose-6-phosphate aminotransferase (isomerizing)
MDRRAKHAWKGPTVKPETTHFLRDILRQPEELRRTFAYLEAQGQGEVRAAADALRGASELYLTGIGSSWHAALTVSPMFYRNLRPVYLLEASELVHFAEFRAGSAMIVISRSGKSIEIVQLVEKARRAGAKVVGVTNAATGFLAQRADFPVVVPVEPDHAISVNTYTTLAAAAGVLAQATLSRAAGPETRDLFRAIELAGGAMPGWRKQLAESKWIAPRKTTYFLARGGSLGSANEARLLWEEGVKAPATAMGTGSFRHGPQEMVREGMRFGIWLDASRMRSQDLAVARDLEKLGALVMLIGQECPQGAAELVFDLPPIPGEWQFLVDSIPTQLAAEQLARVSGEDSDTFRLCSFIVEDESGLLGAQGSGVKP